MTDKKKKLYISCPARGFSLEQIEKNREKMHKIAELVLGEDLEVIDAFSSVNPPPTAAIGIWNLGGNIKKMASADYFIGVNECWDYPDCSVEKEVADIYMEPSKIFLVNREMLGISKTSGYSAIPIEKDEG